MLYEKVEVNSKRWFDLTPLLNEEFRDISNYEGLYQISNYGRVKSYIKSKKDKNGNQKVKIIIKKQNICKNNGYYMVTLFKNNKYKTHSVHRLVAKEFLLNKDMPCINHKDENKLNNRLDNLEWCTYKYNLTYNNKHYKIRKKINQYDLDGNFIKTWNSVTEISNTFKISRTCIIDCCKKIQKTSHGYKWEYASE